MSEILQVRVVPWAGLGFVVFLSVYSCGFFNELLWDPARIFAVTGAMVGIASVYFAAWKERRDWIALRRFLRVWKEEPFRRALEATPDWMPVALFALICAAATSLLSPKEPINWQVYWLFLSPLTAVLLMFRDVGLLYFFSLGERPDRANAITLVYLVVLYVVLPPLLNLVGTGYLVYPILLPSGQGQLFWLGPIIAVFQVGIVFELLRRRIQMENPTAR
ncbi:membrane hypothetical protein [Gammaproteobacteria bacterium]